MASEIKVNNIKRATGTTITLGESGDTIALACGASQTGFGRTGTVDWCTTVKTAGFTAANGKGYLLDTTSTAFTVILPCSPSAGDIVAMADYAGTFDTNAVTLCRNSSKIKGGCNNLDLKDERMAATIIYSGAAQGWISINNTNVCGATLKPQTYNVRYTVIAGGAAGAPSGGGVGHGGGGAGGYRTVATKSFSVCKGSTIPVTVGGGGANPSKCDEHSGSGTNSVFSTITSAGGGGAAGWWPTPSSIPVGAGLPGGSGGGGGKCSSSGSQGRPGGTGNDPAVSPPQGNDGGDGNPSPNNNANGGGGGGAGAVGGAGGTGIGGIGSADTIFGSSPVAPSYGVAPNPSNTGPGQYFAGGGGGAWYCDAAGGYGGGGAGTAVAGSVNTGGGGGGGHSPSPYATGGAGGSGIVVIRRVTACSTSTSGNAVGTCGSDTIHIFTATGTFVA